VNFDDNAIYRHKDLLALRDYYEEEPLEIQASRNSINYIRLDGTIGCMVNGAGLAMATMDIIKLAEAIRPISWTSAAERQSTRFEMHSKSF